MRRAGRGARGRRAARRARAGAGPAGRSSGGGPAGSRSGGAAGSPGHRRESGRGTAAHGDVPSARPPPRARRCRAEVAGREDEGAGGAGGRGRAEGTAAGRRLRCGRGPGRAAGRRRVSGRCGQGVSLARVRRTGPAVLDGPPATFPRSSALPNPPAAASVGRHRPGVPPTVPRPTGRADLGHRPFTGTAHRARFPARSVRFLPYTCTTIARSYGFLLVDPPIPPGRGLTHSVEVPLDAPTEPALPCFHIQKPFFRMVEFRR